MPELRPCCARNTAAAISAEAIDVVVPFWKSLTVVVVVGVDMTEI